ncbi:MAG: class I SAM-dependent methyltransferase [Aggregatilineales bacterium]
MIQPNLRVAAVTANDTTDFYTAVAEHYHLFYRDWEAAIDREGATLRRMLNARGAKTVLDASCGPGTQAIGLARMGFAVVATDINATMIGKARVNAARYKVTDNVRFGRVGFLDLGSAFKPGIRFDAVITKGNALPHLLTDDEIKAALRNFHALLKPGGILIVGIRDFDFLLEDRPRFIPGQFHDNPDEQHILFDIWDWDDGPPNTVTFNKFIVSGHGSDYTVRKDSVRYRALRRTELEAMLAECGFADVQVEQQHWELVFTATRQS